MPSLSGSKTHENLKEAFAGESQANRRYLYFAQKADVEGYPDVAALFRSVAEGETGHAFGHFDFLAEVGDPVTGVAVGATEDNLNIDFPVRVTATTLTVKQASGGIVTPPTGSESEKFEFITLNATGNQLGGTHQPVSLSYEVWYDLPSLRKEAVVTMAVSFVDSDGTTFQKTADFNVAP